MDKNCTLANDREPESEINPASLEKAVKKADYSKTDVIFALISLLSGYLFIKNALFTSIGLGMLLYVCFAIAAASVYFRLSGVRIVKSSFIYPALLLIFALPFILSPSAFIRALCLIFEVLTYIYWIYTACGNSGGKLIGDGFFHELFCGSLAIPFGSFGDLPEALCCSVKKNKGGRIALYILSGALLAVLPTLIVIFELKNADAAFQSLIDRITANFTASLPARTIELLLAVPAAFYLFGLLRGCAKKYDADSYEEKKAAHKKLPQSMTIAAILPLCAVYAAFFITQLPYYVSAFGGILPDGYSFSEYARRGFFELYKVTLVNAAVIVAITLFTRRQNGKISAAQKLSVTLLSAVNLLLIATAVSKMALYIREYGLTLKRVYTMWLMLLTALIFIFITIRQYRESFNATLASAVCFILLFSLLAFCDIDGMVARDNADRCVSGQITELSDTDFYSLASSPEAMNQLVRVARDGSCRQIRAQADERLRSLASRQSENSVYIDRILCYNISNARSEAILADYTNN